MSKIAYYRVSTLDQSIESQRDTLQKSLGISFDKEFIDEGVSGSIAALDRKGFKELMGYIREGDSLYVYSVDRLGRDAIDIQQTVRDLLAKGVSVNVHGLGVISKGAGEIILAVLAQVAAMERDRINERTKAGRELAKETLRNTGKTHRGKLSMGRPLRADPDVVKSWRSTNNASIKDTADHFNLSTATVKRYMSQLSASA